MTKRRLKKPVVYSLYALGFVLVLSTIYLLESSVSNNNFQEPDTSNDRYVNKTGLQTDQERPVVSTSTKIIRPYKDSDIKMIKNYYDYQAESEAQQNSILYHENTYLQNSGVDYQGKENFDVVAILDGTVISVKEDNLLGKIVQIEHENGLVSIYQSLSEVTIKEKDTITQGTIIGKSGTSNISTDLGNHLHFEMILKGEVVNPEAYYDKLASEL